MNKLITTILLVFSVLGAEAACTDDILELEVDYPGVEVVPIASSQCYWFDCVHSVGYQVLLDGGSIAYSVHQATYLTPEIYAALAEVAACEALAAALAVLED